MDSRKMCVIIGAGLNITPDKSALFNADVGDGDRVMPVGISVDALDALAEFARRVYLLTYQDLDFRNGSIVHDQGLNLIDAVASLRGLIG